MNLREFAAGAGIAVLQVLSVNEATAQPSPSAPPVTLMQELQRRAEELRKLMPETNQSGSQQRAPWAWDAPSSTATKDFLDDLRRREYPASMAASETDQVIGQIRTTCARSTERQQCEAVVNSITTFLDKRPPEFTRNSAEMVVRTCARSNKYDYKSTWSCIEGLALRPLSDQITEQQRQFEAALRTQGRTVQARGIKRAYDIDFGKQTTACLDPRLILIWLDLALGSPRQQVAGTQTVTITAYQGQVYQRLAEFRRLYASQMRVDLGTRYPDCVGLVAGTRVLIDKSEVWGGQNMHCVRAEFGQAHCFWTLASEMD